MTSITEVQRMEAEVITLQELFTWKLERVTGERVVVGSLVSTGLRPTFLDKFEKRGVSLPAGLFLESDRLRVGRTTGNEGRRPARAGGARSIRPGRVRIGGGSAAGGRGRRRRSTRSAPTS